MDLPVVDLPVVDLPVVDLLRAPAPASQPAAQVWSADHWPAIRIRHDRPAVAPPPTSRDPASQDRATPDREAVALAAGIAQRILEVASGRRGAGQVRTLLPPDLLNAIRSWPRPMNPPPQIRRVRAQTVRPGVIEAAVVYEAGGRVEILAMQLRQSAGGSPGGFKWRCSALECSGPTSVGTSRAAA